MLKVIILQGLPASGKSTWAKKELADNPGKYKRVNKDELRAMLDGGKWSSDNEKFVLKVRDQIIMDAFLEGKHLIIDDTNLHPKHVERITDLCKGVATVEIKNFDTSVDECIKRDSKRSSPVGKKVIQDMYKQYLQTKPPVIEHNPNLPTAIMCDMDGTLALMQNRSPYDGARCNEDKLNYPVYHVLSRYFGTGMHVILCSGRSSEWRDITEEWLSVNGVPYTELLMRAEGDVRNDAIVKEELYNTYIRDKYNVLFVLDDRNRVVEKWREMGLTVFQVADGDF